MTQIHPRWPRGDGEMAAHIRAFDWAATPLGPTAAWSERLKVMVEQVLANPLVSSLVWGPERVLIYNDAAAMLYGDRHPAALGCPLAETFPEGWTTVAPFYERAFAGETVQVAEQPLDTRGEGQATEVFDALLTPVYEADASVAFVHMTGTEIGARTRAQAALRMSEARHRLLIESWAQATWETDAAGVVVADSLSWHAYTGQTLEEWLGYGWLDAIHPDDRAYAERQWREAVAAQGLVNAEFRLCSPDGGWRWTNVRAAPVPDESGQIRKWAGINIDIDARKQAEASLRESEELRRIAVEGGGMGTWRWNLRDERIWGDAAFMTLWGFPPSEEPRRLPDFTARMSPQGQAEMAEMVMRATAAGEAFDGQLAVVGGPTSGRWVRWRGRAEAERPWIVNGVSFDVTDQRMQEQRLRESEARYRNLFETMNEGYLVADVVFDDSGRAIDIAYVQANPAATRMVGTDLTGRRLRDVSPLYEEYWYEIWGGVALTGRPERLERFATPEGIWYEFHVFTVEPDNRDSRRVAVVFQDVTERRKAEDALRESEEKYRTLFESMDEACAVVEVLKDDAGKWVDFRFLDANPAFMVHTNMPYPVGQTATELLGTPNPRWTELYGQALDTGEMLRVEESEATLGITFDLNIFALDRARNRVAVLFTNITDRKRAEAALRESEERQAYLLALSDALRPLTEQEAIQAEAMRLLGEYLGVNRAQYYTADEAGEYLSSTGGYTNGIPAAIGQFRLIEFGQYAYDGFHAGDTQVVSDATTDPRISEAVLHSYETVGFLAYIGVPFVQRGRLVGTVAVHQTGPRRWTDAERMTVEETAERAGIAVEQARAEAALRESREKQAFLLRLSDALRPQSDPVAIQKAAMQALGSHLGVNRAFYGDAENDHDTLVIGPGYSHGTFPLEGQVRFSEFELDMPAWYRAGRTYVIEDTQQDQRWGESARTQFRAIEVGAAVGVPLVKGGRVRAIVSLHQASPRRWADAEIALLEETAERTWAAVERARAEAALRASEERFAQFADASAAGLWVREADTLAMEYVSPAIATIYGVGPEDLLGDVTRWAAMIVPEDRGTARKHLEQARAGDAVVHEFRIQRPSDGALRWIRNTDFPLRDGGHIPRIGGIAEDVTDAKRASERLEVLVNELQHRSRNLLGVVTAMANRTIGRGSSAESFLVRLKALSRAQALLSQSGSDTVAVEALVRAELAAHADNAPDRIVIGGPAVALTSQQVQNFALALHELTTNAVKYGALKDGTGHLSVTWELIQTAGGRNLALSWTETGVDVQPEKVMRRGYGRELIEQALAYALGGRTEYALEACGVRCRIELPIV